MRIKIRLVLIAIVLFAAFLRLQHLGKESLTMDEVWTARAFLFSNLYVIEEPKSILPHIVRFWFSQGHFPTYFLMMDYWIKVFGSGEFALRFPSAIFGILSVYLVFLLGKRLFDERTGLLAGYLFATSLINIYYAQCARPYSMALFFVLLSFLFFLEALERNSPLAWLSYSVFTLIALLTSASVLPVLICQIIFLLFSWKKYRGYIKIKMITAAYALILLMYLPLLSRLVLPNLKHYKQVPLSFLSSPSLSQIIDIFNLFGGKVFIDEMSPSLNLINKVSIFAVFFTIALLLLFSWGVLCGFKKNCLSRNAQDETDKTRGSTLLLSMWLVVPIILPFVFSCFSISIFGPVRFVLYASCAYYLLSARGLITLNKKVGPLLITAVFLVNALSLHHYYQTEKRTNWRKISNYLKENIKQDEKTAFRINNSMPITFVEHMMLSYYSAPSLVGVRDDLGMDELSREEGYIYKRLLGSMKWEHYNLGALRSPGIWFIAWNPQGADYRLINNLLIRYTLTEEIKLYDVVLYHFRVKMH